MNKIIIHFDDGSSLIRYETKKKINNIISYLENSIFNKKNIEQVDKIGNSIEWMGDSAFQDCINLKGIQLSA